MSRRVPVLYQSTPTECGIACLAMVAGKHGHHVEVRDLREHVGLGRDGTSLRVLAESARELGFEARALRAPVPAVHELPVPFIAHWAGAHYVVVEGRTSQGVRIVDPATGRRTLTDEEFAGEYAGVALTLRPDTVVPLPRRRAAFLSFVSRYVPRSPRHLLAILAVSLLIVGIGLAPALLTRFVVDDVIPSGDGAVVRVLLVGIVLFLAANVLSSLARSELLLWLQTVIDVRMMTHFMQHLLSLPFQYFQLRRGGDLLVRASSTAFVRDLLSGQVLAVLLDTSLVVVYLAVIAASSWVIALAVLVIGVLQVTLVLATLNRAKVLAERELIAMGDSQSALLETVGGMESIKSSGGDKAAYARWATAYRAQLDSSVRRRRLDNAVAAVLSGSQIAAPVAVTLLAAALVLTGQLSLGSMLAVSALAGAALSPLGQLGASLQAMQSVRVHLDRIRDVLDEQPETVGQGTLRLDLSGQVELVEVGFRYAPSAPWAVRSVTLTVPPGGRLAIVGHSGSGKSTLARVLTGLLPATEGSVLLDGHDIDDLDLERVRSQCGVVTQSPALLSGDLRTNITLADPAASDDDVLRASRTACLHDDVEAMPLGYSTPLGDQGVGLSGGQLQRLALARALVNRPKILVLDEATSHLDALTESRVFAGLRDLECTQVIVAHRLSTVRDADQIAVLHDGEVVDVGTHTELVARCQHYAVLVEGQLASATEPAP